MQNLRLFDHKFCFFHRFRAHLSHTKLCYPSVSVNRQQISAGKQHVKAVKVFSKTSIHYLDIAEIPLPLCSGLQTYDV